MKLLYVLCVWYDDLISKVRVGIVSAGVELWLARMLIVCNAYIFTI